MVVPPIEGVVTVAVVDEGVQNLLPSSKGPTMRLFMPSPGSSTLTLKQVRKLVIVTRSVVLMIS
jgi:hypothetical protein